MVNPFNPGDKVLILRKGFELEATVRTTWNHEVQVRIADGELLWRTVKTARLIVAAPAVEQKPIEETTQPVEEVVEATEPGPVLADGETQPEHAGEQPEKSAESASVEEVLQIEAAELEAPEVVVLDEPQQPRDSRSKKSRKRERSRQSRKPKDGSHPF